MHPMHTPHQEEPTPPSIGAQGEPASDGDPRLWRGQGSPEHPQARTEPPGHQGVPSLDVPRDGGPGWATGRPTTQPRDSHQLNSFWTTLGKMEKNIYIYIYKTITFLKEKKTRRQQIASIDEFYHLSRIFPFPGERGSWWLLWQRSLGKGGGRRKAVGPSAPTRHTPHTSQTRSACW